MASVPFHEWMSAAVPANPDASPQQLADYYRTNYGGGPTEDDYTQWHESASKANPTATPDALRAYYTQTYGEIAPPPSDVKKALSDAWSEAKGIGGGLVGLAGQTLGVDSLRDWGLDAYQRNMADVQANQRPQYQLDYLTDKGTLGDWVDAAQYHVTKGIPQLIGGLGAGLIGKQVLKQGVKTLVKDATEGALAKAGTAGFYTGLGGYSVGQELGQIYPDAVREQGARGGTADDVDLSKVYGYGALSGAVETASELLLLGLTPFAPGLARALTGFTRTGSVPARIAKTLGVGTAVEGTEEGVQNPLEYLGADRQLGTPEFWKDERQSVFAGALGGLGASVVTAPLNLMSGHPAPQVRENQQADLINPPSAPDVPTTPAPLATAPASPSPVAPTAPSPVAPVATSLPDTHLEATNLGRLFGLTGKKMNQRLAELGLVEKDQSGKWVPKPEAEGLYLHNTWKTPDGKRSGTNLAWDIAKISEMLAPKTPEASAPATSEPVVPSDPVTPTPTTLPELSAEDLARFGRMGTGEHWGDSPKPPAAPPSPAEDPYFQSDELRGFLGDKDPTAISTGMRNKILTLLNDFRSGKQDPQAIYDKAQQGKVVGWKDPVARFALREMGLDADTKRVQAPTETPTTSTPEVVTSEVTDQAPPTDQPTLSRDDVVGATRALLNDIPLGRGKGALTATQKQYLLARLTDTEAKSFEQIGKEFGTSRANAHARYQGAVDKLKGILGERGLSEEQVVGAFRSATETNETDAETLGKLTGLGTQVGTDELSSESGSGIAVRQGATENSAAPRAEEDIANIQAAIASLNEKIAAAKAERKFPAAQQLVKLRNEQQALLAAKTKASGWARGTESDAPAGKKYELFHKLATTPPTAQDLALVKGLGITRRDAAVSALRTYLLNSGLTDDEIEPTLERARFGDLAPDENTQDYQDVFAHAAEQEGVRAIAKGSKNAALQAGIEPGNNEWQSAKSPEEVAAAGQNFDASPQELKHGEPAETGQPTTRQAFEDTVRSVTGRGTHWRITTYDTAEQARAAGIPEDKLAGTSGRGAYGWVENKGGKPHATFILERVPAGQELSTFLHEATHVGQVDAKTSAWLQRQVEQWGQLDDGSLEAQVGKAALDRVAQAETSDAQRRSEIHAYTVEEAVARGVDPTALNLKTPLGRWLHRWWTMAKQWLRQAGLMPGKLSARDVVDLAYAMAGRAQQANPSESVSYGEPASVRERIAQAPEAAQSALDHIWTNFKAAGRNFSSQMAFTPELARRVKTILPSASRIVQGLTDIQHTFIALEEPIRALSGDTYALDAKAREQMFEYMRWSTREGKWGHVAEGVTADQIDPEAEAKFEALDPKARPLVVRASNLMRSLRTQLNSVLTEKVDAEYDPLIERATGKDKEELIKSKASAVRSVKGMVDELDGPYFPLRRFGGYVVTAMSPEFQDVLRQQAQERHDDGKVSRATAKQITEMEQQAHHYAMFQVDSEGAAKRLAKSLAADPKFGNITNYHVGEKFRTDLGIDPRAMDKLAAAIRNGASFDPKTADSLLTVVNDLTLANMDAYSARQAGQKRRKIHGEDQDMMRSLESYALAMSHLIAHLTHQREVNDALYATQAEARAVPEERNQRTEIFNEIFSRYKGLSEYRGPDWQDTVNGFTGFWQLALSPRFIIQQLTQTPIWAVPHLAGRFGAAGYPMAWAAISRATKNVMPLIHDTPLSSALDLSKIQGLVGREREMLEEMLRRARLDVGVGAELGSDVRSSNQFLQWYNRTLRRIPNRLEFLNRAVTALAAYRMNLETLGHDKAVDLADEIVQDSQILYDKVSRPRIISQYNYASMPAKMLFQFKTYQLGVIQSLVKMAHQAVKGETPEIKAAMRWTAAYTFGHLFLMGGALGIPAMAIGAPLMALLFRSLAGDDKPDDFENLARKGFSAMGVDSRTADFFLYGAPAALFGVVTTDSLGAGSIIPYSDVPKYSQSFSDAVVGVLGPGIALGKRWADGFGLMAQGDYYKGMEKMLPTGPNYIAKAIRQASEGDTTRNGDVVIKPEDISAWNTTAQALGFPSMPQTKRWKKQGLVKDYERNFDDKTAEIKRGYSAATRDGNRKDVRKWRQEWLDLQQTKRDAGIRPAPISDLMKAPMEQAKRERDTLGGIKYDRGNRGFVNQTDQLYGD